MTNGISGPNRGNRGRIFRAGLDIPENYTPSTRPDIECVIESLPEPIDLVIDPSSMSLFWTDRGDVPFGNSVNCCPLSSLGNSSKPISSSDFTTAPPYQILVRRVHEPIGLKLDVQSRELFVAEMGGCVYGIELDSLRVRKMYEDQGSYTGITLVSTHSGSK